MLVTRRAERLACVTQYGHGAVAGALAAAWGNARFERCEPHAPLAAAATRHDDGWHALDDVPHINSDAGRPAHFLEVPLAMAVAAYAGGVEALYADDPHAGVLVSMHWSGLYSARWGLQAGGPSPSPLARATAREQERRWREVALEVWGYEGPRSAFESRLWHDYEVLQALDLISLYLCLTDLERATGEDAPAVSLQATLAEVEQRPGARLIDAVPTVRGGEHLELAAAVLAPGVVGLEPWPFGADAVEVEIPLRVLERPAFPNAVAAAEAYHGAAITPRRATIVPAPPR